MPHILVFPPITPEEAQAELRQAVDAAGPVEVRAVQTIPEASDCILALPESEPIGVVGASAPAHQSLGEATGRYTILLPFPAPQRHSAWDGNGQWSLLVSQPSVRSRPGMFLGSLCTAWISWFEQLLNPFLANPDSAELTLHWDGRYRIELTTEDRPQPAPLYDWLPAACTRYQWGPSGLSLELDPFVFEECSLDLTDLRAYFTDLTLQFTRLQFRLGSETIHHPRGFLDWIQAATYSQPSHITIFAGNIPGGRAWGAYSLLSRCGAHKIRILRGFANGWPTLQHGTHEEGLLAALGPRLTREKLEMVGAVAVWLDHPHWGGSTKDQLLNPEILEPIQTIVAESACSSASRACGGMQSRERKYQQ